MSQSFVIHPPIIAHRGAKCDAPENTLTAFQIAKTLGLNWVEFDVMLAACGEPIIIHDDTLNRTTNGQGKVIDYPYEYLKTLDAGSWFNPTFLTERIPTLRETIDLLNKIHLNANIEIKLPSDSNPNQAVKKIMTMISSTWKNATPPLISSFSMAALRAVRDYSPTSLLGFLMDEWQSDWKTLCDELNCVAVDVNHLILTPERVSEIKKTKRMLLAYTVNDPSRLKELLSWGVDAVFSDCPASMLSSVFF